MVESFGATLNEWRIKRGLTLQQASAASGVSPSHLSRIEAELRGVSAPLALRITQALDMPFEVWIPKFIREESRVATLCHVGRALLSAECFEWAEAAINKARSLNRTAYGRRYSHDVYTIYGHITYHLGRFARAAAAFCRVERGAPHLGSEVDRGKLGYNFGQALARIGRKADAVRRFEESEGVFRRHHRNRELGVALVAHANVLLESGRYHDAEPLYAKAAHLLRGLDLHFEAALGRGICIWNLKPGDTSLAKLEALVGKTPPKQRAKVHHCVAVALRQLGRHERAIRHLHLAVSSPSSRSSAAEAATWAEACLCFIELGRFDSAREALIKARTTAASGQRDLPDEGALAIMAGILNEPLDFHPAASVSDDYEGRMTAALALLQRHRSRLGGG